MEWIEPKHAGKHISFYVMIEKPNNVQQLLSIVHVVDF